MEPADKPRVRYVINTTIEGIFKNASGWYIHFKGSWESLWVGMEEPDFVPGDRVKITFERQDQ